MDYCTLFPEGWWAHCCQAHDLAYANQVSRAVADLDLFWCVMDSAPNTLLLGATMLISGLMYLGVTVFGNYFYKRAKR
jgi:hypothetical protein